eukprot:240341-Chlamydomonas_euryale.AAC.7
MSITYDYVRNAASVCLGAAPGLNAVARDSLRSERATSVACTLSNRPDAVDIRRCHLSGRSSSARRCNPQYIHSQRSIQYDASDCNGDGARWASIRSPGGRIQSSTPSACLIAVLRPCTRAEPLQRQL